MTDICPACGERRHALSWRLAASHIECCEGCGLGRTVPPPSQSDGQEHFAGDAVYEPLGLADNLIAVARRA